MNLPAEIELYAGNARSVALSPDGARVAFLGVQGGIRRAYLRQLDQFDAVAIPGTETAQTLFFSPDGSAVGFVTAASLIKVVSLSDGAITSLTANADYTVGATWGADNRITFGRASVLWQVPASGGTATQITTLDKEKAELLHVWPTVVADGQAVLFASVIRGRYGDAHIHAVQVATGKRISLVESASFPLYTASGHLMFFRDGALYAAPFDAERLAITGPPIRVVDNLAGDFAFGAPFAALSNSGSLLYMPRASASGLVWVSREGAEQRIGDAPRRTAYPRISPDGHRIVSYADGELWIQDTARPTFTPLTSEGFGATPIPAWTPDGKRIVFHTRTGMRWIDVDAGRESQPIPDTGSGDYPTSVSPDGTTLAILRLMPDTFGDIYVLDLHGHEKPRALVNTAAYEGGAKFSPDGHWLAYVSDASGQMQVYVRPFPEGNRRLPVSTDGGTHPLWSGDGKNLFYRNGNKMMVIDVSARPDLAFRRRNSCSSNVTASSI